jgi:hypothetical protein
MARILKNTDIAFIVRSNFDRSAIHRIVAGVPRYTYIYSSFVDLLQLWHTL